ncbi:MAG: hypothetical protein QJR01_06910 [Kyrpidia sp.]|nr:hypothetical protein [Kyrpidia sp.]
MDELRVAAVFRASIDRLAVVERMKVWRSTGVSMALSRTPEATVYTACSPVGVVRVRAVEDHMWGSASFYGKPGELKGHGLVKAWMDLVESVGAEGTAHVNWKGCVSEIRFTRGVLCWEVLARTDWDHCSDWDLLMERETWTGHVHRLLDVLAQALVVQDTDAQRAAVSQLARAQQHLQRVNQELEARRGVHVSAGRPSAHRG